eukprot:4337847-Ditylum_brightwellii.AAC.1
MDVKDHAQGMVSDNSTRMCSCIVQQMHYGFVGFLVGTDCCMAILLIAANMIKSTAQVQYNNIQRICWMRFLYLVNRVGDKSGSGAICGPQWYTG